VPLNISRMNERINKLIANIQPKLAVELVAFLIFILDVRVQISARDRPT
jgi:hypothetical protein